MKISYTDAAINPPADFEPDSVSRRQHFWGTAADPFPYAIGNGGNNNLPVVSQIFAILEYVFEALENDERLLPERDHHYIARPQWESWEERDKLIAHLDAEFAKEVASTYWHEHRGAKRGADFSRLDFDGRAWLCQAIDFTITALGEPPRPDLNDSQPPADYSG